jgi:hypothetical protein
MRNPLKDPRYSVRAEFTGHHHHGTIPRGLKQGQQFVARFCGDWIGAHDIETSAWALCVIHDDERTIKIL